MIDRDDARLTSARVWCVALIAPCGNRVAAAEWRTRAACEWPDRTRRSHRNTSVWIGGRSTRFPRWSRALRVEGEGECDPHHARVHRCNICTDNDATRYRDANILWFVHYITHLIPVQLLWWIKYHIIPRSCCLNIAG